MINNILLGLMAAQVVCGYCMVVQIKRVIKETEKATVRIQVATERIKSAEKDMREMKDEVIKEFKFAVKKEVFNLALLGIRVK